MRHLIKGTANVVVCIILVKIVFTKHLFFATVNLDLSICNAQYKKSTTIQNKKITKSKSETLKISQKQSPHCYIMLKHYVIFKTRVCADAQHPIALNNINPNFQSIPT